jgi:hypothetical protein
MGFRKEFFQHFGPFYHPFPLPSGFYGSDAALQHKLLTNATICFRLQIISGAVARPIVTGQKGHQAPSIRSPTLSDHPMRGFGRAFCDALAAGEPAQVAPFLDDHVDWIVFGPVDLFPFFGHRKGKAQVLAMLDRLSPCLELIGCDTERTLGDGDHAASMLRVSLRDLRSGRTLSLRLALFAHFSGERLITLRAVFDTFDAAEQALGRHIDISAVA